MRQLLSVFLILLFLQQTIAQTTTTTTTTTTVTTSETTTKFEQTDKGSHLAGGTIVVNNAFGYSSQGNLFTFNLNPNYGYFFANKLAIGGELSFLYSSSTSSAIYTRGTLSPFVRYYFSAPKAWMLFGYASAGGGWQNYNEQNVGVFTFQGGPGLDFFVNEHVAFETILTYGGSKLNAANTGYSSNIGLKIGLQVFF